MMSMSSFKSIQVSISMLGRRDRREDERGDGAEYIEVQHCVTGDLLLASRCQRNPDAPMDGCEPLDGKLKIDVGAEKVVDGIWDWTCKTAGTN